MDKPAVPLARFLRYTTKQEPALSVSVVAAIVLALIDRFANLTDADLQLFAIVLVPIVSGVLIRFRVWAPATVDAMVGSTTTKPQGGADHAAAQVPAARDGSIPGQSVAAG